jgi:fructose-specific phosphotransferase system IIA component
MVNQFVISQVIRSDTVDLNLTGIKSKEQLLDTMISMFLRAGVIESREKFLEAIYEREALGPTYMDNCIAIPHGKSMTVKTPCVAFARCNEGVFYNTQLGGGIVKLIFMLAIPGEMSGEEYIRVLSRLARLLIYEDFIAALYKAETYDDVIAAIKEGEKNLS